MIWFVAYYWFAAGVVLYQLPPKGKLFASMVTGGIIIPIRLLSKITK